jgi:hypothetical protein
LVYGVCYNCWRKNENEKRLQVKRTKNIIERCDKIKGKKRKANTEEQENNDNVNRKQKCSHDIKVTTCSQ